jgi:hypothetical protein
MVIADRIGAGARLEPGEKLGVSDRADRRDGGISREKEYEST